MMKTMLKSNIPFTAASEAFHGSPELVVNIGTGLQRNIPTDGSHISLCSHSIQVLFVSANRLS